MFHPERLGFSKVPLHNLRYTQNAFTVSQKFLNFIIQEGRKSKYNQNLAKIYSNNEIINILKSLPTAVAKTGRYSFLYKNTGSVKSGKPKSDKPKSVKPKAKVESSIQAQVIAK